MEKEEVIFMDVDELDFLIRNNFDVEYYNFFESEEIKHNTIRIFDVKSNDEFDRKRLRNIIGGGGIERDSHFITYILLNDLYERNIIEKGKYIVLWEEHNG